MLKSIKIEAFRNIFDAFLEFSPNLNVFYGDNGAGKTSLIEAIYFLFHNKSFRSHLTKRIINAEQDTLRLVATITNHTPQSDTIGLEKSTKQDKILRLNGNNCSSIAEITRLLPVQLIRVDSYRLFHEGSKPRRGFLDWGLFHVEPRFFPLWQQYNQALQQRNHLLKQRQAAHLLSPWEKVMSSTAHDIDRLRESYSQHYYQALQPLLEQLLPAISLQTRYHKGWSGSADFEETLQQARGKDYQLSYTQVGPHRADFTLQQNNVPVKDILSQGQQKLASYAMHLAHGITLKKLSNQSTLYLIDDLTSELDTERQQLVSDTLNQIGAQQVITCLDQKTAEHFSKHYQAKLFHVEHGKIYTSETVANA